MKRCPDGHITHNDSLTFCTECGKRLEPYSGPEIVQGHRGQNDKKGAWYVIKRVLIVLAVVIVAAVLWISHIINSTTYLTFNTEAVVFSKGGGSEYVSIDYDGVIWEVTYSPYWIDCSESGDNLILIASSNATGETREDHITVKSGKIVSQLPVGQLAAATYLNVNPTSVNVDREGKTVFIAIESDGVTQDITYPGDICSVDTDVPGGFNVSFDYNGGVSRSGTITVKEDNRQASISVHQTGDCRYCNGNGKNSCPYCFGTGSIGFGYFSTICTACGGSGEKTCSYCRGTGEY